MALRGNKKAYIVMPENSAKPKIDSVKGYGGEVVFCGNSMKDREETLAKVATYTGASVIHPYNDWNVIAGQGTVGMEIYEELNDLDYILVPVNNLNNIQIGGGGLCSGILLAT
jgi:threonine dehydratase